MQVHAGQILPCRQVIRNKEFTIGSLIDVCFISSLMIYDNHIEYEVAVSGVNKVGHIYRHGNYSLHTCVHTDTHTIY